MKDVKDFEELMKNRTDVISEIISLLPKLSYKDLLSLYALAVFNAE